MWNEVPLPLEEIITEVNSLRIPLFSLNEFIEAEVRPNGVFSVKAKLIEAEREGILVRMPQPGKLTRIK